MNKRIEWLDISKLIAISIMVLGHLGLPKYISDLIHIFHMPVFFMIAGLCFNIEKYHNFSLFIKNRAKSLLIPYFFWGTVMYCLWCLVPQFGNTGGGYASPLEFVISIITLDAKKPMFGSFGVIQWFLTSLFLAELLMWIIVWFASKWNKKVQIVIYAICCVILIILSNIFSVLFEVNPLGLISSLFGAVMCITGYVSKKFVLNKEFCLHHIYGGIISFVLLIAVWFVNGSTNMRTVQYNNIVLYYIGAVSGSIVIFCISVLFMKLFSHYMIYKVLLYLGQNTIIILCFNRLIQWTVIYGFNGLFGYILGDTSVGLAKMVVMELLDIVVGLVSYLPVIYIINKYLPFSVGRKQKMVSEQNSGKALSN